MSQEHEGISSRKLQERYARMQQQAALEAQKKALLQRVLEPAAYERVMNVKIANAQMYEQLVSSIAYIAQSGRLQGKISEGQIIQLLSKMSARHEPTIEFKHK
ncbi:hypothetical protein FJZ26_00280 [Candidatus Parvarchaeota archaeon]|nr:hypothetical protein [Candidatus Parvarchaeota archaeon]